MTNDVTVPQPDGAAPAEVIGTPGDALRALPAEAEQRGSRFVSAQAMQARLFSVYDAASAAEAALSLVQSQLTLTLNRSYYDADEVEAMASQLDALLMLDAAERIEDGAAVGDADLASVGPEE
jgi:hypothetical protein